MKPQSLLSFVPGLAIAAAGILSGLSGGLSAAPDPMTQDASASDSQAVEGFINVPVQEAWRLFTTPAGYQLAGVGNAEVDLRIGGTIRTVYEPQPVTSGGSTGGASQLASPGSNSNQGSARPPAGRQTVLSEILAYEPQRMLATRIQPPAANFAYRDAIAGPWSVMYFTASGPDMTRVRIVGLGYNDTVRSQALRKFLVDGNRALLDRTAKHYWPKCKLCEKEPGESK